MINSIEFVCLVLKENVTALAVGVVAEQVKENDGLKFGLVFLRKCEVMIIGVVLDELLKRAAAVGTVFTQHGEWDDVKAKRFADEIRGDFAQGKSVCFKIPEGLFALHGFVNGGIGLVLMCDFSEKGVIRAKRELTFEFKVAELKGLLQIFGSCHSMILLHTILLLLIFAWNKTT